VAEIKGGVETQHHARKYGMPGSYLFAYLQKPYTRVIAPAFHRVEILRGKLVAARQQVGVDIRGGADAGLIIPKTEPVPRRIVHVVLQGEQDENIAVYKIHQVYDEFRAVRPPQHVFKANGYTL